MNRKLDLSNFSADYLPFKFAGFWKEGYCFLRVVIKNGKLLVLCVQLPGYTGTSVTNAIESIVDRLAEILNASKNNEGAPVVHHNEKFSFLRRIALGEEKYELQRKRDLIRFILSEATWIEHYPPDVGLLPEGLFARVVFADSGEPIWNYLPVVELENEFGDPDLFKLDSAWHPWEPGDGCRGAFAAGVVQPRN